MINTWFANIIELSAFAVVTILLVAGIGRLTGDRYSPQWRYFIWIFLALRLALPLDLQLPQAIPTVTLPNIVFDQFNSGVTTSPSAGNMDTSAGMPAENSHTGGTDSTVNTAPSGFSPDILTIVSWVWLLGAVSFLFWKLVHYRLTYRSLQAIWQPVGPRELAIMSKISAEMGFKRPLGLYQCSLASSPMLIGYIRPAILLPDTHLTDEQLALVLRHELTHAQRKDLWFMALMTWTAALHWFNPFIHWMVRMSYDDLEKICDSRVIKDADVRTRQVYANTILQYMKNKVKRGSSLTTSFLGGDRIIKERFTLIFQSGPKKSAAWVSSLLLVFILAGGTLVSCQNQSIQGEGKDSFTELYTLFGSSDEEVFGALSLDVDEDAEETSLSPDSTDYLLNQTVQVQGHSSQLQLGFYNDALMALQYRFDNHQDAFDVSKALREEIVTLHGEPSTIENHPNRLDSMPELPVELPLPSEYLEEWSIEADPQILMALFGDDSLSVNLELRLSMLDESHASVSVRYSLNRNSMQ